MRHTKQRDDPQDVLIEKERPELSDNLEEILFGASVTHEERLSGACTNIVHKLQLSDERVMVRKTGARVQDVYEIEAKSLKELSVAKHLRVPNVYAYDEHHLHMEFIEQGHYDEAKSVIGLQSLHEISDYQAGFSFDTYLGHFSQPNSRGRNWHKFFWTQRMLPLLQACDSQGLVNSKLRDLFESAQIKSQTFIPSDIKEFSLLHGDLWSGNMMWDQNSQLVLLDPAVSFGVPEVDYAMALLFGNQLATAIKKIVGSKRYSSLEFKNAIKLYQAYYLLYHLLDCGLSYQEQVCESLTF